MKTYPAASLNAEELDRFILDNVPKLKDPSIAGDVQKAFDMEKTADAPWAETFKDSIYGKALDTLNFANQAHSVNQDFKSGEVDASTAATTVNLALKAGASKVGQKIITKVISEEAGKAVASFAGGPVGTVISVLSTLLSLNDLSKDIKKSRTKARAEAKEKWQNHILNPKKWTYKGQKSDW